MMTNKVKKFSRGSSPVYLMTKGIILIVLFVYFLTYIFFDFLLEIPLNVHLCIIVYFSITIFDVFRRIVTSVEFDDDTHKISISYYHMFFIYKTVVIDYSHVGYLKHNNFYFLKSLSKGLTDLRFYNDRKYIAQVVVSQSGWNSDQLEEMVIILSEFAHEFQLSPGLL